MARIAGINLPTNKRVLVALTYIHGIGKVTSKNICDAAGVNISTRVNELSEQESKAILEFLFQHCTRPEWTFRFRWRPHSIAFWDNRCTQHMAISDYLPNIRSGYRVQLDGKSSPVAA